MFRPTVIIVPLLLGLSIFQASCSSPSEPARRDVERGLDASERYVNRRAPLGMRDASRASPGDQTTIALLDGAPITLGEIVRPLSEIAGGLILEEFLLDRLLERELARVGIEVGLDDADAEEQLLLSTLHENKLVPSDDQAQTLLGILRSQRGLGAYRYRALLDRNAALRALVHDEVTVSPADLEQAYQLRYGPRFRARIMTVTSASQASGALRRLRAGESFAELAGEISSDPSRDRGGLLPPISSADTSFPSALLSALRDLEAGEISPVIALEAQFALVKLESIIPPADGAPASVDEAGEVLERDARLFQERVLMDDLARRLLEAAHVTVLDPGLARSWQQRRGRDAE